MRFRFVPLLLLAALASPVTAAAQGLRGVPPPFRPIDPCRPDDRAPVASLSVSASGLSLIVEVDASDDCGLASVLLAVDGSVVAGRVRAPWSFEIPAPVIPIEICALVTDRAGNSVLACAGSDPRPGDCGGVDCAPDEYCARPEGACDQPGTCEPRPEACTADYDPVCGCDGLTWSNACEAARAGQSIASRGECG